VAQQPPGEHPPPPPQSYPAGGYPSGGYPSGGYATPAGFGRPSSVTAGGVLLIVLGSLAGLGGLLFIMGGVFLVSADFDEVIGSQVTGPFRDLFGAAVGIFIVFGVLAIVYAVFKIIAGAKVLALRNGWRIAGIVLCAVACVGWVISLIGAIQGSDEAQFDLGTSEFSTVATGPSIGGIIVALLFLAANVITIVLLARSGQAFRR
jgi:hypothetical protein